MSLATVEENAQRACSSASTPSLISANAMRQPRSRARGLSRMGGMSALTIVMHLQSEILVRLRPERQAPGAVLLGHLLAVRRGLGVLVEVEAAVERGVLLGIAQRPLVALRVDDS